MEGEPQHPTPDSLLTKDDLKELVETCLAQNSVKTFSLMGYSLGGRIVLQLISLFTDRINTVILFAPDGIRNNWENSFITKTSFGKMVYQRIINNPSRLFKIVTLLKTIKLINPKLSDFVHNQLSTREKRQLVWDVSRYLQNIKPDVSNIQRIINTNKINIHLFFGKYDSIIPPSIGKRFVRGLNNKSVLHIVESGHNLVREKMNAELIDVL
jgi:pimeloyl-ACP methyl ester carboxylesterase